MCRGNWAGNTHPLLVFSDDGQGGLDSDTICIPCKEAMLAKLKEETKCYPPTSALWKNIEELRRNTE